jgi:hypothetical protein
MADTVLRSASKFYSKTLSGMKSGAHRDPDFDREAVAKQIRRREAERSPLQIGKYDRVKYLLALSQLARAPKGLTDEDLEQLTLVSHEMGEVARAARAGYVANDEPVDESYHDVPVSLALLVRYCESLREKERPYVDSIAHVARECAARLDVLESSRGQGQANGSAGDVQTLKARVAALEARHTWVYRGVFQDGETYHAGDGVTDHGSIWVANETTRARPQSTGSKAWTLAVKRGRDGKDAK